MSKHDRSRLCRHLQDGTTANAIPRSHLVDIFATAPPSSQRGPSTTFTGQDARLVRFQDVLAKMSAEPESSEDLPTDAVSPEGEGWIVNGEETDASNDFKVVKSKEIGPLLGGFADLESRQN